MAKKNPEFKPIHATFVLAILCHVLALFAWCIYAAQVPQKEKMRIVAQVDVVDKIMLPQPQQMPTKKLGIEAPKIAPSHVSPPQQVKGPSSANPGKIGKPGAPGKPGRPGAPGDPGGSGRAGLRTAIDPDVPDLGGDLFGTGGYPVGHGSGMGNKHGKGSGYGQGDGVGNGTGGEGGEGGEGGGGDGGGQPFFLDGRAYPVNITSTDSGVEPEVAVAPEGYICVQFVNRSSRRLTMKVAGEGTADIYGDFWSNVPPNDCIQQDLRVLPGWYTIEIYDAGSNRLIQQARLRVDARSN